MRTRVRDGKYTKRETGEHFSKKYKHFSDDLSIEEYYELHKSILTELLRISKTIIWNIQIVTGSKEAIFQLIGYFSKNIKDVIVWDKGHGQPAMHDKCLNRATELLFILEGDAKAGRTLNRGYFNRGEMQDIWRIGRPQQSKDHGATFPEELASRAILGFSKKGGIVYDPFMGSGTVAKVAHIHKRKWIGSEISPEYVDLANKRLKPHLSQINLFD